MVRPRTYRDIATDAARPHTVGPLESLADVTDAMLDRFADRLSAAVIAETVRRCGREVAITGPMSGVSRPEVIRARAQHRLEELATPTPVAGQRVSRRRR